MYGNHHAGADVSCRPAQCDVARHAWRNKKQVAARYGGLSPRRRFPVSVAAASNDSLVRQRLAGASDNVHLFADTVDTKLHPRNWPDGRCVRNLDSKEILTKAGGRKDPAGMP